MWGWLAVLLVSASPAASARDEATTAFAAPGFAGPMMGDLAVESGPVHASMPAPPQRASGVRHSKRASMAHAAAAPGGAAAMMMDGGGGEANDAAVRGAVAEMQAVREGAAGAPADPDALQGAVLLKDGSMAGEVPDVAAAVTSLTGVAAGLGGHVESSNAWTDVWLAQRLTEAAHSRRAGAKPWSGPTGASLVLRLPVARFEAGLAALHAAVEALGGAVTSESVSSRDATGEYVDVLARQRANEVAATQLEKVGTPLAASDGSERAMRNLLRMVGSRGSPAVSSLQTKMATRLPTETRSAPTCATASV